MGELAGLTSEADISKFLWDSRGMGISFTISHVTGRGGQDRKKVNGSGQDENDNNNRSGFIYTTTPL